MSFHSLANEIQLEMDRDLKPFQFRQRAKHKGELHSLSEAIDALVTTAGFRIAPDLLAKVIAAENQS